MLTIYTRRLLDCARRPRLVQDGREQVICSLSPRGWVGVVGWFFGLWASLLTLSGLRTVTERLYRTVASARCPRSDAFSLPRAMVLTTSITVVVTACLPVFPRVCVFFCRPLLCVHPDVLILDAYIQPIETSVLQ